MSIPSPRRFGAVALAGALTLALGACGVDYPNSTFNHHTEFNAAIDFVWDRLLLFGTIVFVIVELALLYTIIRFRRRDGAPEPPQTHGNVALEITWTAIPALILVFIAVPTVKTIFQTQAKPPAGALQVEVIGHQWWWEFRYPEYGITTANELYLPVGRTVNFSLRTKDVLHSFWTPQLGGKRDLISNKTNYLWYTPKADLPTSVWNGFCTEYCGSSHANMKFRVFTVQPAEFQQWVAGQQRAALVQDPAMPAAPATAPAAPTVAQASMLPVAAGAAPAGDSASAPAASGWVFPRERLPEYAVPKTPVPASLGFDDAVGDQRDALARPRGLFVGGIGHDSQGQARFHGKLASVGIGRRMARVGHDQLVVCDISQ